MGREFHLPRRCEVALRSGPPKGRALKDKLRAYFAGERAWHDDAAWRDVTVWLLEIRVSHVANIFVAEIGTIRKIETLEHQFQARRVTQTDFFTDAKVELIVGLAPQEVVGRLITLAGVQACSQLGGGPFLRRREVLGPVFQENHVRLSNLGSPTENVDTL